MKLLDQLRERRATKASEAETLLSAAGAENRDLNPEEQSRWEIITGELRALDERLDTLAEHERRNRDAEETFRQIEGEGGRIPEQRRMSLGEHFIHHCGDQIKEIRGKHNASVAAPEWRANTDNQVTNGGNFVNVLTEYDRTIVQAFRPRLVVADLLGSGTISGNAITYFIEAALEGAFTAVAEAGPKPQLHVVDPTTVTDALKKLAGWIKFTDEMTEDLDFYVSEINGRLMYELARFEEQQLLNGSGSGQNVTGLLNRSGIQTEARGTVVSGDTMADTIFRAITKVSVASNYDADALVLHPTDYQTLRLTKDSNGQYYGGGFFAGQYGNDGMQQAPNVWGLRTVVTPAIAVGTALVGSFSMAATLYRKGGVRVESVNTHASDFTSNLVTTRAEERVALACRVPAAFVKVTTSAAP